MKSYIDKLLASLGAVVLWQFLPLICLAQTPQNLPKPHENEPLTIDSPATLIIYILIPVLALLLYFLMKKNKKRRNS